MSTYTGFQSPLFSILREGVEEIRVYGEIVVTDGNRVLFQTSDLLGEYPARSCLKPFQLLATGILSAPKSSPEMRLAAATGSISASEGQVKWLREWYSDSESKKRVTHLLCGESFPKDSQYRAVLQMQSKPAATWYHTCFSKHMAILAACEKNGWSLDYVAKNHPFQKCLEAVLADHLGREGTNLKWITDGCHLQTPVLTLDKLARLYRELAKAKVHEPLGEIRALMLKYPEWIGGEDRYDTDLMRKNSGALVAKEGADGLLAVAVTRHSKYPEGLGIAVKLANGYQSSFTSLALKPVLESLALKSPAVSLPGQTVKYHFTPFERVTKKFIDISPLVGDSMAVWPGDVPYRRKVTLQTAKGDHLTLSSFEATVHVGAHTDAPNHYCSSDVGIDRVELDRYSGPCQVIEVDCSRGDHGNRLSVADLDGVEIRAKRLLFKTSSYRDVKKFDPKFVALSAELISYVAERGVFFVGVDTPSIDPFDSKDLPSHQSTVPTNVAILEGIDLSRVKAGLYELACLPLKLEDADASPVRAVLLNSYEA